MAHVKKIRRQKQPRISRSGKAATKGYWKCHGKKNTESTEKISSVLSVQNPVAKNLCFCEKDLTVRGASFAKADSQNS